MMPCGVCSRPYGDGMTGLEPEVQRWRTWLTGYADSLPKLDGESGLEFCESATLVFANELKDHVPEMDTVAELIVVGIGIAVRAAGAEAYVDVHRPRADIEHILRDGLDEIYRDSETWTSGDLRDDAYAATREIYEQTLEHQKAKVAGAIPEERLKSAPYLDFDELLAAQGSETRMTIFRLAQYLSPELLAFMLNVSAGAVYDHIPTDIQRDVIAELASMLGSLSGESSSDAVFDALLRYDPSLHTSRATQLHIKCGGVRPTVVDDGSLTAALQTVAMDLIGTRLRGSSSGSSLMNSLQQHPLHRQLIERVMGEDEPIAELFRKATAGDEEIDEHERERRYLYLANVIAHWTDGSGGSVDIRDIPEHILASLNLSTDTNDGVLQSVCDAVKDSVALARTLVTGEVATTVALVGLANVTLGDDVSSIDLPGMCIRRPSPFEKSAVPFVSDATAVVEIETALRLTDVKIQSSFPNDDNMERLQEFAAENDRLKVHREEMQKISQNIAERILQMRFAMALASQQRRLIGPIWLYTVHRNPLTGWGGNSLRPSTAEVSSTFSAQVIDQITAARIAKYCVPTSSLHQSLRIGRDRILRALAERNDPIDSFIDFVIAWESLVGSSENTSYVVSGTMSLLLAPDDEVKRKELFTQIRDLYNNRSGLVHGTLGLDISTKKFKMADVKKYAEASGRLAIDTFKKVLARPELLNLSAQERSRMVMLGFTM
ncbi:hypothetical protein C8E89_106176 [Mycolicibacterium moriokaense]|uniref:Uncharacterized protein n=2 Tax=Mycolicibacterium moriokaense TaxID=39691 RepID=A0A318HI25_9MYCO|nr:hypothetical protein C8E89_106176 [Mycolicibacterium moriokaense]